MPYTSINPGQLWLDTAGRPIQAHGGSLFFDDGVFYWYGENKERTRPGNGIWHWGVRAYASTDLMNWEDRGLIIPPVEDDPASPLHPAQQMDRPHIIYNEATGKYVCWIKVMHHDETQRSTVLTADHLLGPYEIVRTGLLPLGMSAGDFDLTVDPRTRKAYYYFERVHSALICAELTEDYTDVSHEHSSHLPHAHPPQVREAPAFFRRNGRAYLLTSGTTWYFPNPSEAAIAEDYHGPWRVLGDLHPGDTDGTSYSTQISSVFRHPLKQDLYIAVGDRWAPDFPTREGGAVLRAFDEFFADPDREIGAPIPVPPGVVDPDVSRARYVWLPIRFDGERPVVDWLDAWRPDDYR